VSTGCGQVQGSTIPAASSVCLELVETPPGSQHETAVPPALVHGACNVFLSTAAQCAALKALGEHMTTHSSPGQREMVHAALWSRLEALFKRWKTADASVLDASARLLFILVSGNPKLAALACPPSSICTGLFAIVGTAQQRGRGRKPKAAAVSGALWALCSLMQSCQAAVDAVVHGLLHAGILDTVALALQGLDARMAACWFLRTVCTLKPAYCMQVGTSPAIVAALRGILASQACTQCETVLALSVLQALGADSAVVKSFLLQAGIVTVLVTLAASSCSPPEVIRAAVVCCRLLAARHRDTKEAVLLSGMLDVVHAFATTTSDVGLQSEAISSMYNYSTGFPKTQSYLGDRGALETLAAVLSGSEAVPGNTDRVLSAMLSLTERHPDNQLRLAMVDGIVPTLQRLLTCNAARTQGLAIALTRTLMSNQPKVQVTFGAKGILAPLLSLCGSLDAFISEQAVAALYMAIAQQPCNQIMLYTLHPTSTLVGLLVGSCKRGSLACRCALMVCYVLCTAIPEAVPQFADSSDLQRALLRFLHPSCPCTKLRALAGRLLWLLNPHAYESRVATSALATLDLLIPVLGLPARTCAICFEEDAAPRYLLPCYHEYHVTCFRTWMESGQDTCPTCRNPVVEAIYAGAALPRPTS